MCRKCTTGAAKRLILLVYPPIVIRLLFGSETGASGVLMTRVAGIALIALGVACWPDGKMFRAFLGMLTYTLLAMLYLVYVDVNGGVGILLWPALAEHAAMAVLLFLAWRKERKATQLA